MEMETEILSTHCDVGQLTDQKVSTICSRYIHGVIHIHQQGDVLIHWIDPISSLYEWILSFLPPSPSMNLCSCVLLCCCLSALLRAVIGSIA